jgi:hypothetical protein
MSANDNKPNQAGQTSPKKPTPTKPEQMPAEVLEFVQAIDDYKRENNRPFPSWSEVLEIVRLLGYEKVR